MLWGGCHEGIKTGGNIDENQTFTFYKLPGCRRGDCFAFIWQTSEEICRHVTLQGDNSNSAHHPGHAAQSKRKCSHGRTLTTEPVTSRPALTRRGNTAGHVTTAAHATTAIIMATIMGTAPAITTADPLTRPTVTIQVGRTRPGVTAHPPDITHTPTEAVIPTMVTTAITHTIHQRMAIADQWLLLCSSVLDVLVTTAA